MGSADQAGPLVVKGPARDQILHRHRIVAGAFTDGTPIPHQQLGPGHGGNLSPQLDWGVPPAGCRAWALTLTDDQLRYNVTR